MPHAARIRSPYLLLYLLYQVTIKIAFCTKSKQTVLSRKHTSCHLLPRVQCPYFTLRYFTVLLRRYTSCRLLPRAQCPPPLGSPPQKHRRPGQPLLRRFFRGASAPCRECCHFSKASLRKLAVVSCDSLSLSLSLPPPFLSGAGALGLVIDTLQHHACPPLCVALLSFLQKG